MEVEWLAHDPVTRYCEGSPEAQQRWASAFRGLKPHVDRFYEEWSEPDLRLDPSYTPNTARWEVA